MPAIVKEVGFSDGTASTIAGMQTAAQALGKLSVAGWLADTLGGRRCYALTMLCTAAATMGYALGRSAAAIGAAAFLVEFCSTPSYPAHVQFVRDRFGSGMADGITRRSRVVGPSTVAADDAAADAADAVDAADTVDAIAAASDRVGGGFWLLGLASRVGDVCSKLGYGAALAALGGAPAFRAVITGGAVLGVCAALFGLAFHRKRVLTATPAQGQHAASSIWAPALRSSDFWLGAAALSCVCVVKRTNELLVGLYFTATAADGLCNAACGTRLAALWSAGVALSVLLGGHAFNSAGSVRAKLRLATVLNLTSALAAAALALLSRAEATTQLQLDTRSALVFIAAAGIGLSYYIPAGMFAVAFGGCRAGTVSAYLDAMSFGLSSCVLLALKYVLDNAGGWYGVWAVLAVVQAAATLLVYRFLRATLTGEVQPLCTGLVLVQRRHGKFVEERSGLLTEARERAGARAQATNNIRLKADC